MFLIVKMSIRVVFDDALNIVVVVEQEALDGRRFEGCGIGRSAARLPLETEPM